MEGLRKPFFYIAIALSVIVVLLELGKVTADSLIKPASPNIDCNTLSGPTQLQCIDLKVNHPDKYAQLIAKSSERPPGLGIPYMALVDSIVVFTMALMGASLIFPKSAVGRTQGCATFIFSVLLILLCIVLIFAAINLLILMVSLFLAVPFGTLAYLAIYGFFDRGGAAIILSLLMLLKLGLGGSLLLAHQRFLQNRGLVFLILTSLLANVIVSFLHGFVPGILVSITDDIAGICNGVIAVIWAILLLVFSIPSVLKVLKPS